MREVPRVMGIVNVTPDSFSDGGVHFDRQTAVDSALGMEADGAAIIDVGGESTRPGSDAVSLDEELSRVLPVIEGIRSRSAVAISIDTRNAAVAAAAIDAGAEMINDVSAFRHDPSLAAVAAKGGVAVVLMHMRGEPKTMQQEIRFEDLIGEIKAELLERVEAAEAAGIGREKILIDPGIGFGKTFEHNLEILARAGELRAIAPVVIGASRKAFIGHLTGRAAGPDRLPGSLAAVASAYAAGAAMVRVHDVRATVDFLKVLHAIAERSP